MNWYLLGMFIAGQTAIRKIVKNEKDGGGHYGPPVHLGS